MAVVGIEQLLTAVGVGNVTTTDDSEEPTDTSMFVQLLMVITALVKSGVRKHSENSEVLELLSLAVAVTNWLAKPPLANGKLNVAPPLRSVVTSVDPKKFGPAQSRTGRKWCWRRTRYARAARDRIGDESLDQHATIGAKDGCQNWKILEMVRTRRQDAEGMVGGHAVGAEIDAQRGVGED